MTRGDRVFPSRSVTGDINVAGFSLSRDNWPDGENIVSAMLQLSEDNGVTWNDVVGVVSAGGSSLRRDGTVSTATEAHAPVSLKANPNRLCRIIVNNKVDIRTTIDAVFS